MNTESSYKLIIPRVDDHFRRSDLMRALASSHARHPLTWVMGLPGSGKTSLVSRWAQESGTPCIWYHLEDSDNDVAGLFHALVNATTRTRALPVWSPEHQADLPDFARRLFAGLASAPITLVLDDCHRIPDDSATLGLFEHVVKACADTVRVVLISRRYPPPGLARGRRRRRAARSAQSPSWPARAAPRPARRGCRRGGWAEHCRCAGGCPG